MMKQRLKEVSCVVLFVYGFMLIPRCFVFSAAAETKDIQAKIFGTGPNKIWINAGAEQGVVLDMIFDVKRGEELLARIKITKVGKSSSEGAVVELNQGKECAAGDSVKFYAMPKTETKTKTEKEEKKIEKTAETTSPTLALTTPETKTNAPKTGTAPEVKKDATPATQPAVETKKEVPKTEPKKEEVKKTKSTAKKSKGFLNKKMLLYLAVIGGAAFALSGGGKSGSGGLSGVDPYTGVPDAPSISGIPGF